MLLDFVVAQKYFFSFFLKKKRLVLIAYGPFQRKSFEMFFLNSFILNKCKSNN